MSKGQHLTRYQQGIVRRYYQHLDGVQLQKLQEMVSDLALADTDKARDKLWKRVETAVAKFPVESDPGSVLGPGKVKKILESRDLKGLAELVGRLSTG